jgi:hypothetical protein
VRVGASTAADARTRMRALTVLLMIASLAFIVLQARTAAAEPDRESATADETLFTLAQQDERDLELSRALVLLEAALAAAPMGRNAGRAAARIEHLKTHAEGDFAPLIRLERVRRDPILANDGAAIDSLVRDAAEFPPGLVRVEARMLAAEAYLGRLHRRADGLVLLASVVDDPHADPMMARQAAREIVETHAQAGELEEATRDARALRARLAPAFVISIERLARRRVLHIAALFDLAMLGALLALALVRAVRRAALPRVRRALVRSTPLAIAFAAYVAIGGGLLASSYEAGNAVPFFALGAAALPLAIAARAWGAAGSSAPWARAGRAMMCASAALAVAFVLLERIDAAYLEGFGL